MEKELLLSRLNEKESGFIGSEAQAVLETEAAGSADEEKRDINSAQGKSSRKGIVPPEVAS